MKNSSVWAENQDMIDSIGKLMDRTCKEDILNLQAVLEEGIPKEGYSSVIDKTFLRTSIYEKQKAFEDYYGKAKSINNTFIQEDDKLRQKFLALAELMNENSRVMKSLRDRRFPRLSKYIGTNRIDHILTVILNVFKDRRNESMETMIKDIDLTITCEYYEYALGQLRDVLLDINFNRIKQKTLYLPDLLVDGSRE